MNTNNQVLEFVPAAINKAWDNIEIDPIIEVDGGCEVCDKGEENFWSVYVHNVEGGVSCIADVPTEEKAIQLSKLIGNAVKHYAPDKPAGITFTNGFTSWMETHHEVVEYITFYTYQKNMSDIAHPLKESADRHRYAQQWTEEFETLNAGNDWEDREFIDEVITFVQHKINAL